MTPFDLTPEQTAILAHFQSTPENILVNAKAGSGKTATIALLSHHAPPNTVSLMFNRDIKEDAIAKQKDDIISKHIQIMTLNGLGHRVWGRHCGQRLRLENFKCNNLAKELFKGEKWVLRSPTAKLVSYAKSSGLVPSGASMNPRGLVPDEPETWKDLITLYDIDLKDAPEDEIIQAAREVLRKSILQAFTGVIDFSDQLYMPVIYRARFDQYDCMFVDEAQDLAPIQHKMIELAKPRRLVAVGDPNQAIYGFRGADSAAWETLEARFKMEPLPLNICFRCDRQIIHEAQRYVPDIQPRDNAPLGQVIRTEEDERGKRHEIPFNAETIEDHSAIICRNNAPLLGCAFALLAAGRPVILQDKDFGKEIILQIKKLCPEDTPVSQLLSQVTSWAELQRVDAELKEYYAKAQQITDKEHAIKTVIKHSGAATAGEVVAHLEKLFAATIGRVTLTTGHKAKGREWDTVYFLNHFLIPSRYATTKAAEQQELNLKYVITTRARHKLIYIVAKNDAPLDSEETI